MNEKIKKYIYLAAFTFLGLLVSFIAHALLEVWYIGRLLADFDTWGLGLSWATWFTIHAIFASALAIAGLALGWAAGQYWWRVIYVEKRYKKFFWRNRPK